MPKRDEKLQVRGEDVRGWIRQVRLYAFPVGTSRVLEVHRAFRATFPPIKQRDRDINRRRMTIPAGSILNSRWVKVNKTWDVWSDVVAAKTPNDVARLRDRSIIQIGGNWYIQIYEVVSGVNKLRRQRVKIRANYHQEVTWRHTVMASVERDISLDAMGAISLSPAERRVLNILNRQIERRIETINTVRARLSPREVFAYAVGLTELETLRRVRQTLQDAVDQPLTQAFKPNFDRFLARVAEDLDALVNLDVRHNRFWAQYHIRRAAEVLRSGPLDKYHHYLGRAIECLDRSIETLQGWADSLSEEEAKHAITA